MKKAWEVAIGPSKQIPMNAIMMYMSGNSLQIFSIMMVLMLFKGPIQGIINTNAAFAKYETPSTHSRLLGVKVVYMAMQLVLLGLGIWKVNAMGLLPYVWSLSSLGVSLTLDQNYEIRLACVGIGTATSGACSLCFQIAWCNYTLIGGILRCIDKLFGITLFSSYFLGVNSIYAIGQYPQYKSTFDVTYYARTASLHACKKI